MSGDGRDWSEVTVMVCWGVDLEMWARMGGPSVDAVVAWESCGRRPEGWKVVREKEYRPSIGSVLANVVAGVNKRINRVRGVNSLGMLRVYV